MKKFIVCLIPLLAVLLLLAGCAEKPTQVKLNEGLMLTRAGLQDDGSVRYTCGTDIYLWTKDKSVLLNGELLAGRFGGKTSFALDAVRTAEVRLGKDGLPETVTVDFGTALRDADYLHMEAACRIRVLEGDKSRSRGLVAWAILLLVLGACGIFAWPKLAGFLARRGYIDSTKRAAFIRYGRLAGIVVAAVGVLFVVLACL